MAPKSSVENKRKSIANEASLKTDESKVVNYNTECVWIYLHFLTLLINFLSSARIYRKARREPEMERGKQRNLKLTKSSKLQRLVILIPLLDTFM